MKGKFEGRGFLTYANGDTYEGNFKDNMKDGYGVLKLTNHQSYQG